MTIPRMTTEEATAQGLVEHMIFSSATEILDSQFGAVPYEQYLSFEGNRICKDGDRRAAIVKTNDGLVALFVDNVAFIN
jgi:hypothetical protein